MKKLKTSLLCCLAGFAAAYIGVSSYYRSLNYISKLEDEIRRIESMSIPTAKTIPESDIKEVQSTSLDKIVIFADQVVKESETKMDEVLVYEVIARIWDPNEKKQLLEFIETHSYQDVINFTKNPVQARKLIQLYQERNNVQKDEFRGYSFKEIHEKRLKVDCIEAATIAAAVLSDDGYQPIILALAYDKKSKKPTHGMFVYRYHDKLGFIDNNLLAGPVFGSVHDIIEYLGFKRYLIMNFENEDPNWITTTNSLNRRKMFKEDN
jgi:hypothetical protein